MLRIPDCFIWCQKWEKGCQNFASRQFISETQMYSGDSVNYKEVTQTMRIIKGESKKCPQPKYANRETLNSKRGVTQGCKKQRDSFFLILVGHPFRV